jgi:hypothetical protein
MSSKTVNFQCVYEVPDEYEYVALNLNGTLVGFRHAPIRDTSLGEWIDSVNGSVGEILPYHKWETSVRQFSDLSDFKKMYRGVVKHKEALQNAEKLKLKLRKGKS